MDKIPKSHMLMVRMDKNLFKEFKIMCAQDDASMAEVVTEFITVYLKTRKEGK